MKRSWIIGGLLSGVGALALVSVDPEAPPAGNPVYSEALVVLDRLQDAGEPVGRIPMEWAAPAIARAGLREWVQTLPLKEDVKDRVLASIDARNLVDELIPFALFLKEVYGRAGSEPINGFDAWARVNVTPGPGLEHDNFRFEAPAPAASTPTGFLTPERIAGLVTLYDAAWLSTSRPGDDLGERLHCTADGPDIPPDQLAARVDATRPILRGLFAEAAAQMEPGDIRTAAEKITTDDVRQSAIAATLLQFVDGEVCKHYRVFARRLATERAVRSLLDSGIDHPADPAMWTWLHYEDQRHLAVQIIVDGLQGRLVRALANPTGLDPYLAGLLAAETAAKALPKPTPSAVRAADVHEDYLPDFAVRGGHPTPYLEHLLSTVQPGIALQGISTTPTISVRNLPIVKTGAPVAGEGATGIPNFHFVDRSTGEGGRAWYFYGNDAVQLPALARAAGMKTLFERLERLDTMSCGAQYDERAGYSFDAFLNLAIGERKRDFGEAMCADDLNVRARNEVELRGLRSALLEREAVLSTPHHVWEVWDAWNQRNERVHAHALAERIAALSVEAMPDLLQWYDPWPDHFAHGKGPLSDEIVSSTGELARLDHWLGLVDAAYSTAGVRDRTLFGMAGDHGLTSVHWFVRPETEVLDGMGRDGIRLKVTKISSDEGEGPRLTDPLHPPSMRGWDVIVASTAGGNYMMDWFVDQGANWSRQPVLSELRALKVQSGQTIDVVDQIVRRLGASLDYLVVREGPCDPTQAHVYLEGDRDGRRVVAHITRVGDRISYVTDPAADLLDVRTHSPWGAMPQSTEACTGVSASPNPSDWCAESEWRSKNWATSRPDAVAQLAHLYDTDRAGTVNLFPRDGIGYNTVVPGRHAGESYAEKDAFVGVWGAPVDENAGQVSVAVNGAMPEAIYAWITGQEPVSGKDGWGYEPVLDQVLRKQAPPQNHAQEESER